MNGSTWLEPWQGVSSEQCGVPVAPHSGGNFTYTYFNNQITVNGQGAHLGLPKAYNGGELSSPNNAVSSITYDINFSSDYDTMIVDIQSAGGGNGWWRFIYQRTNLLPAPLPQTYTVNFEVRTDLIAGNVSADGIYIGGGVVGGHNALLLNDSDGDGTWTGSSTFHSSGGYFTILNGNCSDWSCKEDISEQSCADPNNYNADLSVR